MSSHGFRLPRSVVLALATLVAAAPLAGCDGDRPTPVASAPAAPIPLGLKAVLTAPPGAGAPQGSPQVAQSPAPPTPTPVDRHPVRAVARIAPSSPVRPLASSGAPPTVAATPIRQGDGEAPLDAGPDASRTLLPRAFASSGDSGQPASSIPPGVAAYAPLAPEQGAPAAGQVNDLLSVLQSGQRARSPLAPALLPSAPTPDPSRGVGQAAAPNPIESVRASVQPGSTSMRVLSAPGMTLPDDRVRQALDKRRSSPANEAGAPVSQRDLEGLF